ncbi:MAG: hypothetical protein M0D55_20055 [Elusimicrobiota bacterium]|nr:MAG: hypothetical protein M0D55_20055 [Elusimicrobiota bacterium]
MVSSRFRPRRALLTRKDFLVVAALAAAVLALTAQVWAVPGRAFFNHGDLYAYHWPLRHHTAAELISGRLPFWNPYVLLGVPHSANPQSVLFYPAAALGFFFPAVAALVWDQVLHLLWAGLGAYLLARASRLPRAGAAALAAAYALSPFLIYRITAGIPTLTASLSWAPWAWLAWLHGSAPLLSAVWALQFLSGHPQFLLVNAGAMALWASARPRRFELAARFALGGAGALALAAVQWVPMLELLRGSNRSTWPAEFAASYSLDKWSLLSWLSPGALGTPLNGIWDQPPSVFYESCGVWLGCAALGLAAVAAAKRRAPAGAVLLVAAGVLLALGANGPFGRLLGLPGFSYLRTPSRWAFLTLWGLWLLAGAGARAAASTPARARALAILPLFVLAELALWDRGFLRSARARRFVATTSAAAELGGRPERALTDPALANPNKAIVYRIRNANGYDAFYPGTAALWAAQAEGAPAADSSRVYVSRWRSEAAARAGITTFLTADGLESRADAWPLAAFLDASGRRLRPDPVLSIDRPGRWRATGPVPAGAAAVSFAETRWPGWRASLGGAAVPLVAWGPAFQAAPLPLNTASLDLRFEFVPTAWAFLAALTAAAWALWAAALARRAA